MDSSANHSSPPPPDQERADLLARLLDSDCPAQRHSGPLPSTVTEGPESAVDSGALAARATDRYRVEAELSRGGMGAVLRAFDRELDRRVALKVLRPGYDRHPEALARFLREARVGGQLQHPDIVAVYDRGTLPDGRVFIAMKLVEGRTLAALLAARQKPEENLPRLLAIFEKMCQAIAYAHSQGIVHRDLKPANVMVGAFGEVQVMDWGLAKRIDKETGRQGDKETEDISVSLTPRVLDSPQVNHTEDGAVLGTYAYMAPEQANGAIDQLDERCDVFGLGAVLCEILTGKPPYTGTTHHELRDKAQLADLGPALARLDRCGVDVRLIDLMRACLLPDLNQRPRNASAVFEAVAAYRASVEEALRAAEKERAAAEARAQEAQARAMTERRARRLTLALAVAALLLLGLGGAMAAWRWQRHLAEATAAERDLAQAEALHSEKNWPEAREMLEKAEGRLGEGHHPELRERIQALRDTLDRVRQQLARIRQDEKMVATLEDARMLYASVGRDSLDRESAYKAFEEVFSSYGIPVHELAPQEAADRIRASAIREQLVMALDSWAAYAPVDRAEQRERRRRLVRLANLAEGDAWRRRVREAVLLGDKAGLHRMLEDPDVGDRRLGESPLLELACLETGDRKKHLQVLRAYQSKHPGDFWARYSLSLVCLAQAQPDEALVHAAAAQALKPNTPSVYLHLGLALHELRKLDEAVTAYQVALRLKPDYAKALNNLGNVLRDQGKLAEAVECYQKALRLLPESVALRVNLSVVLERQNKLIEAANVLKEALKREPDDPAVHLNFGGLLVRMQQFAAAETAFRKVLALKPEWPSAHLNLANAQRGQQKHAEAEASLREAIRLAPHEPLAHYALGNLLFSQGKVAEAEAALRQAVHLKPAFPEAHGSLGTALLNQGKLIEAETAFREAIRLRPEFALAHSGLGTALIRQDKFSDAIAVLDEAIRLAPRFTESHVNQAMALRKLGRTDEAVAALREALRLDPCYAEAHAELGNALHSQGKLVEATDAFREALRLKPDYLLAGYNLGLILSEQGKLVEAVACIRETIRRHKGHAESYYNLGVALDRLEQLRESADALRTAVRLKPDFADAHYNLGVSLLKQRAGAEAATAFQTAARLRPDHHASHYNLGLALLDLDRHREAEIALRAAVRLKPDVAPAHYFLGVIAHKQKKWPEAVVALREAARLQPRDPNAAYLLGDALSHQNQVPQALAAFRRVLQLQPENAGAHCALGHLLKRQGKLTEALTAYRRGHEFGSREKDWNYPTARWVREAERLVELDARLPALLDGKDRPKDAQEQLELARLCRIKGLHAAAARFFADAFAARPELSAPNRMAAVRSAVSASSDDAVMLDDRDRAGLRGLALDWLRADLEGWEGRYRDGNPPDRVDVAEVLVRWQRDEQFAGLRNKEALSNLPAAERSKWKKLWKDVDDLARRAREQR